MLYTGEKLLRALILLTQFVLSRAEFQVATGKPATQSSTYSNFLASRAVDGDKGSLAMDGCSHTADFQTTAWWRVDLEKLYFIRRILIYPRPRNISETQGRFAGFSVAVSEYEETGYRTYFDYGKGGILPNVLITHTVNCTPPTRGRYVMISNNRDDGPYGTGYSQTAFINLCEVEIFVEDCFDTCIDCVCSACQHGYYGTHCNRSCSGYCGGNGSCRQDDGRCGSNSCLRGYYGEHCRTTCSPSCVRNTCNLYNGYCDQCIGNYFGINCSKNCPSSCRSCKSETICTECENGWYGSICANNCNNCGSGKCEKDTGICQSNHCKAGYFTVYCNSTCSHNCGGDGSCDVMSGACNTCIYGYFGTFCEVVCFPGCKLCMNSSHCLECNSGLYGNYCNQTCLTCGGNETCDMMTGYCKDGCKSTFYGMSCELKCPKNCRGNGECTSTDGVCVNGCGAGWKGNFCNIECGNNTFGESCSQTCGKCKGNLCHHVYGTCLQGCQDGMSSFLCDIEDDKSNAAMLGGAIGGSIAGTTFVILGIFAVLYVLCRRYRNKTKEKDTYMSSCYPQASEDRVYTSIQTPSNETSIQQSEMDSFEGRIEDVHGSYENIV